MEPVNRSRPSKSGTEDAPIGLVLSVKEQLLLLHVHSFVCGLKNAVWQSLGSVCRVLPATGAGTGLSGVGCSTGQ